MNKTVEQYVTLCDFLGEMFGAHTEIALHDLSDPGHSLVKLVHPKVSGRREGAPVANFAVDMVQEADENLSDFISGFASRSIDNRILYSGMFFIREESKVVGLLCINRDITSFRKLEDAVDYLMDAYIPGSSHDKHIRGLGAARSDLDATAIDRTVGSVSDAVETAVNEACASIGCELSDVSPDDRLRIFQILDSNGIFMLKGAVGDVARLFGISEPTVYRGLRRIRRDDAAK